MLSIPVGGYAKSLKVPLLQKKAFLVDYCSLCLYPRMLPPPALIYPCQQHTLEPFPCKHLHLFSVKLVAVLTRFSCWLVGWGSAGPIRAIPGNSTCAISTSPVMLQMSLRLASAFLIVWELNEQHVNTITSLLFPPLQGQLSAPGYSPMLLTRLKSHKPFCSSLKK